MTKYFHELTKEEYDVLKEQHITWKQLAELHPQPEWCNYPEAVCGDMGCWSLMSHRIHNMIDCGNCDEVIVPKPV